MDQSTEETMQRARSLPTTGVKFLHDWTNGNLASGVAR